MKTDYQTPRPRRAVPVPAFVPALAFALAFAFAFATLGAAHARAADAGAVSGKTPSKTAGKTKSPATATAKTGKKGAGGASGSAGKTETTAAAAGKADAPGVAATAEPALTPPPPGSSPLAELKKSNDQLDKLIKVKKKYPAWSPEGEAQRAEVRKLVGGFLDYGELARRALAKHWDGLTPAQRQDFVSTLRELVERSYLKQVGGDANYNIKYENEEKTGSEAVVNATLATVARGKKVNIALQYKLVHKNRWLVYDVVTDEQSMLENYRAEFNKLINKEGFDALLKRMKKKLEEKEE
jgi:phospholipid transport system substrate-binding protein